MVTSWGLVGFFRCFLQRFIIDPRWVQEFFHEQYQYISIFIYVHKNMYMLTQISCCVMEFSGIHENMNETCSRLNLGKKKTLYIRWASTSCKRSQNTYKWPYKWVSAGISSLVSGVMGPYLKLVGARFVTCCWYILAYSPRGHHHARPLTLNTPKGMLIATVFF